MTESAQDEISFLPSNRFEVAPSLPDIVDYSSILPKAVGRGFQVESHNHAAAILAGDFPMALSEIDDTLGTFRISLESLVRGGGGEHELTQRLRSSFGGSGWPKHEFIIKKLIDGTEMESVTHEIDHVRRLPNGTIALEIEWNNKDPFFDRDLENFKRLHGERVISVGILLTRGRALQDQLKEIILRFARNHSIRSVDDLRRFGLNPTRRQMTSYAERMASQNCSFEEAWSSLFVSDKYGQATTHWNKLDVRVRRGVGNPCPLLLIGIPPDAVVDGALSEA